MNGSFHWFDERFAAVVGSRDEDASRGVISSGRPTFDVFSFRAKRRNSRGMKRVIMINGCRH